MAVPLAISAPAAKNLCHLVACVISHEKAYNVPGVCTRFGLAEGSGDEAFASKYKYVAARTSSLTRDKVLALAQAVQDEYADFELGEALARITGLKDRPVSELTRRRVVDLLHRVRLSTRCDDVEFLDKLWPLEKLRSPQGSYESTMRDHIAAYCFQSDHPTSKQILEFLDIYGCSQALFFRFLEALVDPVTREPQDQIALVDRINEQLALDGFSLREVGRISGSPRFAVRELTEGTTPADAAIGEALAAFDPTEIHQRWEEALKRRASDPRAAITSARTLLEDTCKWIIHEAGQTFREEDDLPVLYRSLAKILKLAPDDYTEQVFKQILGSCQSIVESLGAIRNKLGDAHSQGPRRAKPQTRHAELAVNLAGTMATFLIATWEARSAESEQDKGVAA